MSQLLLSNSPLLRFGLDFTLLFAGDTLLFAGDTLLFAGGTLLIAGDNLLFAGDTFPVERTGAVFFLGLATEPTECCDLDLCLVDLTDELAGVSLRGVEALAGLCFKREFDVLFSLLGTPLSMESYISMSRNSKSSFIVLLEIPSNP